MFRFLTAGESHGPALTTIIEGVPAGLGVTADPINLQLKRRQGGYGRGARQKIETDTVEFLSGVRFGRALGSPITMVVRNRDWANWTTKMSIEPLPEGEQETAAINVPRPGHADYAGMMKYDHDDLRNVLERSSARNTATVVAVGAVARLLLAEFGIEVASHVVNIGGIKVSGDNIDLRQVAALSEDSPVRVADKDAEQKIITAIDEAKYRGDTLGGVFEVVVLGLPVGLGSYVHWDERIDGKLAQALMSIQAIKGVEVGMGFGVADVPGSQVHDPFFYEGGSDAHYRRGSNNAGGTEGGMSNGEPLVIRAAMKPIPTLMKQLPSVNLQTKEGVPAFAERSDVCAVPAASVVGEAMVAIVLAQLMRQKFGGDSIGQMRASYESYRKTVADRTAQPVG
ncbi:chorismate synthase [Capsulimonas corticalis]|uniref:Chorismate synthase n=1 Tax=Capsulimonas corticalis TaxID=2219043 RepID=A0A402CYT1_9BACT|nr:chorismate synthase [Capsulimonas corticalis]BDI31255.1 chorismate synthase [Capsulimonas corticalis]